MKTLIKSSAILAALLGSGLAQADTTTASIPMGLDVPKSCSFSNVSAGIVLPEDGSEAQGSFTFTCNMDGGFNASYALESRSNGSLKVKNMDGISLPITASINFVGLNLSLDSLWTTYFHSSFLNNPITGVVTAKLVNPTTATTPAGVYTDTFRVTVTY
ncbi:hypothetical protein B9T26_15440 [Acinetobacter sp. ANC 4169]|uniref:hypothetical protein n=1 Tax=Acinetobacter sp. ANC 4169 TaxID=1977879 RepID=UPI000A335E60|nr:hypothetical protein [Acinetobacter sp. ANC 4169]OTG68457.1 hypothetical protein B9T26_15440 [Acinetobacter sp. ANC 4169]